jgi:RHS repeat-associated protein
MSDGTNTESYTYDAVGNRTASHLSSSYSYYSFNRIKNTDTSTYTHNANGSRTGKTGATWTYGWDRENRLTSASGGLASVSYAYDALGRRVKRSQLSFGSNVHKYSYDGNDVVLDDINGTITKYQNGPGIDDKLKTKTGTTSQYYLQDHLGSTVALTSATGGVNESQGYDSFGNRTNISFSNRYQYTGREYDPTTGLQYSRARWYDPNLGRFILEDPIGFAGEDVNLYGYVGNNSMNFTDPSGLFPFHNYGSLKTGADVADAIDRVIDRIKRAIGFDPPVTVVPFPLTRDTYHVVPLSEALKGTMDPLRVGQGLGCALYADGLQDYERFDLISADVVRGGTIALTVAGPIGGRFAGRPAGFNPFEGKTPLEIDGMLRNRGYRPTGPDPLNGKGGYDMPNGRGSYHIDVKNRFNEPPHVDVNRPDSYKGPLPKRKFPM